MAGKQDAKGTGKYTKSALCASKRFMHKRDLISALLKDGEVYSVEDAENLIEKYLKGDIK